MQVPPASLPPPRFVLKGKPAERNCSLVLSLFFLSSLLICPLRTQCCFGFVLFYYRHPDFPPPGLGDLHGQSLQQPARPVPPVPPVLLLLLPSAGLPPGLGHVPRGGGGSGHGHQRPRLHGRALRLLRLLPGAAPGPAHLRRADDVRGAAGQVPAQPDGEWWCRCPVA